MTDMIQGLRTGAESLDRNALQKEEEAVEVASQWAQEKIENFITQVESNGTDHKLLKISYVISRRTSVDVFTGKSSDAGSFLKDLISKLADGKIMESLGNIVGTVGNKLMGSASGSAQTERIYEVTFDELGGLNRLDAFFFCYRFASSGITNFSKAVIGTCIVRSAAEMVDDNAYRVVLTSAATMADEQRTAIAQRMIDVAKNQKSALDESGNTFNVASELLAARAQLAMVIGDGVATSDQFKERKEKRQVSFSSKSSSMDAESSAGKLATKISTLETEEARQQRKQLETAV